MLQREIKKISSRKISKQQWISQTAGSSYPLIPDWSLSAKVSLTLSQIPWQYWEAAWYIPVVVPTAVAVFCDVHDFRIKNEVTDDFRRWYGYPTKRLFTCSAVLMLKIYRTSQKLWSIPQRFIICMLVTFSSSNSTIETIPSGSWTCVESMMSRKHFSCQKWRSSIAYGNYCCWFCGGRVVIVFPASQRRSPSNEQTGQVILAFPSWSGGVGFLCGISISKWPVEALTWWQGSEVQNQRSDHRTIVRKKMSLWRRRSIGVVTSMGNDDGQPRWLTFGNLRGVQVLGEEECFFRIPSELFSSSAGI